MDTVDSSQILHEARVAVEVLADRVGELLRAQPSLAAAVSTLWSARDAAAHLVSGTALYRELATGAVSPVAEMTPAALACCNAERLADIAETGPTALATALGTVADRYLDATADRPGDRPVAWHAGIPVDLAQLTCVLLGEYVLHGYDIAAAVGAPWPIVPAHAALTLYGYGPLNAHSTDPVTSRGHTASYGVEIEGAGRTVIRFVDGAVTVRPGDDGPVDCGIQADPVAFLLVGAGRLTQWEARALGLMRAAGPRPELALGFGGLFRFP